jgi:hypothetical protein
MSNLQADAANQTAAFSALMIANVPDPLVAELDRLQTAYFMNGKEKRLVLGRALVLARKIQLDPDMTAELIAACKSRGIRCHTDTEVLNRMLRYIIGDQSRSNSYAAALKVVPDRIKTPEEIADYIHAQGGLEKLREVYAASRKPPQPTNVNVGAVSEQSDDAAMEALLRAGQPAIGATLLGEPVDKGAAEVADFATVSGVDLHPASVAEIEHSTVPGDDADTTRLGYKWMLRSEVTAATLPEQKFVMLGAPENRWLIYVDDPTLVADFEERLALRRITASDGAIETLVASAGRTGGQ